MADPVTPAQELTEWQKLDQKLTTQLTTLADKIAALETKPNTTEADQARITALETALTETREELAKLRKKRKTQTPELETPEAPEAPPSIPPASPENPPVRSADDHPAPRTSRSKPKAWL